MAITTIQFRKVIYMNIVLFHHWYAMEGIKLEYLTI